MESVAEGAVAQEAIARELVSIVDEFLVVVLTNFAGEIWLISCCSSLSTAVDTTLLARYLTCFTRLYP